MLKKITQRIHVHWTNNTVLLGSIALFSNMDAKLSCTKKKKTVFAVLASVIYRYLNECWGFTKNYVATKNFLRTAQRAAQQWPYLIISQPHGQGKRKYTYSWLLHMWRKVFLIGNPLETIKIWCSIRKQGSKRKNIQIYELEEFISCE